jgi:hypothetical protein
MLIINSYSILINYQSMLVYLSFFPKYLAERPIIPFPGTSGTLSNLFAVTG